MSSTRSSSPASPPGSCSIPRRPEISASVSSAWRRGLVGVGEAGQQRAGRLAHDARALADVDPGEVEAEHVDLPQQPPDRAARDVARVQVGEHELEVAPQRLRVGVAGLAAARAQRVAPAGGRRTRAWCAAAPTRGAGAAARARSAAPPRPARASPRAPGTSARAARSARTPRELVHARAQQPQRGACGAAAARSRACRRRPRGGRPCRRRSRSRRRAPAARAGRRARARSRPARPGRRRTGRPRRRTGCGGPRPRPSGRTRRSSSVCHQTVRTSRSSSSSARRRMWPVRGSSRRSSSAATSHWWSSTERRVASVGCAVSTCSICSCAISGPMSISWRRRICGGLGERLALDLAGRVVLAPAPTRSRSSAMFASCSSSEQARMIGSTDSSRDVAQVGDEPLGRRRRRPRGRPRRS